MCPIEHCWKTIEFWVRVPVLSEKMYSICPKLRSQNIRVVSHCSLLETRNEREDNLLIRQVPTSSHGLGPRLFIRDLIIVVDKCGLGGSDKLDRDVERDRNNVLESD